MTKYGKAIHEAQKRYEEAIFKAQREMVDNFQTCCDADKILGTSQFESSDSEEESPL